MVVNFWPAMAYDNERLNRIFDKTDENCHICHKRLVFLNYAKFGTRGAWEVEHSKPLAAGGTDHLNNLFAACISCNRQKGADSTRKARRWYGKERAPYSQEKKGQIRNRNTVAGLAGGTFLGAVVGGPPGALLGAAVGGVLGRTVKVPK